MPECPREPGPIPTTCKLGFYMKHLKKRCPCCNQWLEVHAYGKARKKDGKHQPGYVAVHCENEFCVNYMEAEIIYEKQAEGCCQGRKFN